jgi:hypothetical protein
MKQKNNESYAQLILRKRKRLVLTSCVLGGLSLALFTIGFIILFNA